MIRYFLRIGLLLVLVVSVPDVWAAPNDIETIGEQAVRVACDRLEIRPGDGKIACLTNAGYVTVRGRSTRPLLDVIPRLVNISMGKGTLLPVHDRRDAPLFMAFVAEKSKRELMMVLVRPAGKGVESTQAINVHVDRGRSFEGFAKVFGKKAFSLVTLANGWADDIPEELMSGALFHDHLCCGVSSGYFTVNFIRKNIPLHKGQRYRYIGAPAWCQDDYIITAMNLTPGKHGYYTMGYPWYRPWETGGNAYNRLGGILIRYDDGRRTGQAHLLGFDWQEDEFRTFAGVPAGQDLDWKGQPWLHVLYNRFLMKHRNRPEHFVSVMKTQELKNDRDLGRLIDLGSNPLEEILGPDETWAAAHR